MFIFKKIKFPFLIQKFGLNIPEILVGLTRQMFTLYNFANIAFECLLTNLLSNFSPNDWNCLC